MLNQVIVKVEPTIQMHQMFGAVLVSPDTQSNIVAVGE